MITCLGTPSLGNIVSTLKFANENTPRFSVIAFISFMVVELEVEHINKRNEI